MLNTDKTLPLSAIVLAGGRGTRMQEQDKGWVEFRGQALITRTLERLAPQVDDIVISCNRNLQQYQQTGYPCVSDELPDYPGPLAGIAAALPHCQHGLVQLCPCDTPLISQKLSMRLLEAMVKHQAQVVIPHDGKQQQVLHALVHRTVLASIRQSLEAGEYSAKHCLAKLNPVMVDFSEQAESFRNINRPEDLT